MTGWDAVLGGVSGDRQYARDEVERARRDPRLGHGREAVVAHWRSAMESAERVRRLAVWGLHELRNSEDLERLRLARTPHDADYEARALRAARERAALAEAEADNQMVELNAMTLVAMMSATDALVEELVPHAHAFLIEWHVHQRMEALSREHPEATAALNDEQLEVARRLAIGALKEQLGDIDGAPPREGSVTELRRW